MTTTTILIIAAAVILSLGGGIFCIVRYAKTRKVVWLIVGLVLTFILPGLFVALGVFISSMMIVVDPIGPPPMPYP